MAFFKASSAFCCHAASLDNILQTKSYRKKTIDWNDRSVTFRLGSSSHSGLGGGGGEAESKNTSSCFMLRETGLYSRRCKPLVS